MELQLFCNKSLLFEYFLFRYFQLSFYPILQHLVVEQIFEFSRCLRLF
jgi:hypothetical protein